MPRPACFVWAVRRTADPSKLNVYTSRGVIKHTSRNVFRCIFSEETIDYLLRQPKRSGERAFGLLGAEYQDLVKYAG